MNSKGFTLIELIVVMAVFLFIIGAALGIFISIVSNQREILSETQLLNQVSYVEEYMSKSLRMAAADTTGTACFGNTNYAGYIYLLTNYDSSLQNPGFKGIEFMDQSGTGSPICEQFIWDNTDGYLEEIKNGGSPVQLTAPNNLKINSARFSINGSSGSTFTSNSCTIASTAPAFPCGASTADSNQPRVTVLLNVQVPGDNNTKTIQTTISQRDLNVK